MTTLLKFCGMRSFEDYKLAVESNVDYIGFVFAKSKRQVTSVQVKRWTQTLPPKQHQRLIGVFVNESIENMLRIVKETGIQGIQCHGTESKETLKKLKKLANPTIVIWKAIHEHRYTLETMKEYENIVDGYVIDTKTEKEWGGTGKSFDWSRVPLYTEEAKRQNVPCFIAGGVNEENIEKLLTYSPIGIDISSGIETEESKDERKMSVMMHVVKSIANNNLTTYNVPDTFGRFGTFGGKYVPETLMFALEQLEIAFQEAIHNKKFFEEVKYEWKKYSGRPTPITEAVTLTKYVGGAKIFLKREDLNHTGAHKINNAIAQALLAKRMGKKQIIAETGAGQHGVAAATVAARYGLSCKVFMGEEDMKRQELNVFRMRLLGAEVVRVTSGGKTLKDATNEAIRHWVTHVDDTYYLIGSAVGPHPYPKMVREFQSVIGKESKEQFLAEYGKLPDEVVACVGGGSNAIGMFYPFIEEKVRLTGVEAAGKGLHTNEHAAALAKGKKGVLHGSLSYLIQDETGNIVEPYSISAGLDYPGIGPEHAYLKDTGRVIYESITDEEALEALKLLCELEGILPALESAHAVAYAIKKAKQLPTNESILVCLSGRGDKDVHTIQEAMGGSGK